MNYLGHIFLSGNDEHVIVGNFIGDYVKGKKYLNYPEAIQKGICFHRAIDYFTDSNNHWQEIRELIRPVYKRYSGIVADLFIDHFLAANWDLSSTTPLHWYTKEIHAIFLKNYRYLPEKVQGFLAYLIQHKRLLSYAQINGIRDSLYIMSLRSSMPDHSVEVTGLLEEKYGAFKKHASAFLDEAMTFANDYKADKNKWRPIAQKG